MPRPIEQSNTVLLNPVLPRARSRAAHKWHSLSPYRHTAYGKHGFLTHNIHTTSVQC